MSSAADTDAGSAAGTDEATVETTETETEAEEVAPRDDLREGLLAKLREALGDAVVGDHIAGGDIVVRVAADAWLRAARFCKDSLDCDHLLFVSGIDWLPRDLKGEKVWDDDAAAEEAAAIETGGYDTGVAGGDTRFQVFGRVQSTRHRYGITLKADLDEANPRVDSWVPVYRGADWHERETWEMYGFDFIGHPGLRHLYLPMEFEGFPQRKDFPLLAREVKPWPGLVDVEPLPGEEAAEGEGEGGEAGAGEEG